MAMTDGPTSGQFVNGVHIIPIRIYFEDTDFSGVVYHANYLRYFERGRSDCLRSLNISHTELFQGDTPRAWAIRRMNIDFIKPARIDDALEVHTAYTKVTGARLFASQAIKRAGQDLVRVDLEAACITADGKPTRIPGPAREALSAHLASLTS